jgi:hypothetical protein
MESAGEMAVGVRRFLRPKILIPAIVAVIAICAFAIYWFQPQALFLDKTVDEKAPEAMMKEDAMAKDDAMAKSEAMMSLEGAFRGLKYETKGTALLTKGEDGAYTLRLEDFETQNGPDLKVYLSAASSDADPESFDDDFVNLGELKGNIGNQNYPVPDGIDLSKYKSIVIWCKRFAVGFGVAPLETKV